MPSCAVDPLKVFYDLLRQPARKPFATAESSEDSKAYQPLGRQDDPRSRTIGPVDMAVCFLRLENFNPAKLDLIGRYETRLWRQLAQAILLVDSVKAEKFRHRIYRRGIYLPAR